MPADLRELGLPESLLDALSSQGITAPTPVQSDGIPPALAGRDVIAQAATGSGKTLAFVLPLLARISRPATARRPEALVLCPTRELADQVTDVMRRTAARIPGVRVITLCGGRPLRPQRRTLAQGVSIVVGTPGRVADHLRRETLVLDQLAVVVLDEADRMLDMGFEDEVTGILDACPEGRQTLMYSATFPDGVRALSERVQHDAVHVAVEARVAPARLQQAVVFGSPSERHGLVASLIARHPPGMALVFAETRDDTEALAGALTHRGGRALALHGGLDQRDREAAVAELQGGSTRIVVATNVAARGLDIDDLPLVVIAEIARDPAVHLHRIGRTGRAGASGRALSVVVGQRERERLEAVESLLGATLPVLELEQATPDLTAWAPDMRTVVLGSGRRDKLRRGDLLGALVKDAGLPPEAVGRIDVQERRTFVAIARALAPRAHRFLNRGRVKRQRVRSRLLG
jgi:ATP-independent RNA helicase DbpA